MDPNALKEKISGIFLPISTPFLQNEETGYEGLIFNLRYYIGPGDVGENATENKEKGTVLFSN